VGVVTKSGIGFELALRVLVGFAKGLGLLLGIANVVRGQASERQLKDLDVVAQGEAVGLAFSSGSEDALNGISDAHGDFLALGQAAETKHALVGFLLKQQMGGLIAGGTALGQDKQVLAEAVAQLLAGVGPIVGAEAEVALVDLRGAGDVDHQASESTLRIVGRKDIDAVVFVALNVAEGEGVGIAVHGGAAGGIGPTAVAADHGLALAETDGAGGERLPGLGDDFGDDAGGEFLALGDRHHGQFDADVGGAGGGTVVAVEAELGASVRVGGIQDDLARVKGRGHFGQEAADGIAQVLGDADQIAANENGVVIAGA